MPEKFKTDFKGVFWRPVGDDDKAFYVVFRKDGKMIEQNVGRESEKMTPEKADIYRSELIAGRMQLAKAIKKAKRDEWKKKHPLTHSRKYTLSRIWRSYKKKRRPGKSLKDAKYRFDKYLKKPLGNKLPAEITFEDITKLKRKMRKKGLAAQSQRHVIGLLTWIINYGAEPENGFCERLPFKIKLPRTKRKTDEYLNKVQLKKLLDAIEADKNIQIKNLMKLALFTGMRRGELFKLKWNDIDFENNWITVRNPKGEKIKGSSLYDEASDQLVPLNELAKEVLENHPDKSAYVFPGQDGKKRVTCAVGSRRIRDRAGLPKSFRPLHGLRHAYASMLANSGKVTIFELQKLMRHSDIRMTERYSHLLDEGLKRAAAVTTDVVNEAIGTVTIKRRKKKPVSIKRRKK